VPAHVKDISRGNSKCKCTTCRLRGAICSWGEVIPRRLYPLKLAILKSQGTVVEGSLEVENPGDTPLAGDAAESDLSEKSLTRLISATTTAIREAGVQLEELEQFNARAMVASLDAVRQN